MVLVKLVSWCLVHDLWLSDCVPFLLPAADNWSPLLEAHLLPAMPWARFVVPTANTRTVSWGPDWPPVTTAWVRMLGARTGVSVSVQSAFTVADTVLRCWHSV
jgi:hypothetical protein